MSILSWLFKPKKEMAKPNTKRVKIGKYTVTSHAQNRVVDCKRNLKKIDMLDNLLLKPIATNAIKFDDLGRPSYKRIGKKASTWINPQNNFVTSIKKTNMQDIKKGERNNERITRTNNKCHKKVCITSLRNKSNKQK